MKIDLADVFASGVGLLVRQIVLFALAVWAGCILAGSGWMVGEMVDDGSFVPDLGMILISPVLLLTGWLVPNLIFLGINFCRLVIYSESTGVRTWAALVVGEALFAMGMVTREFWDEPWPLAAAWATCLILIGMACTAFWFLHQWQINRWAGELAMLKAENAARRAEMKENFGTESAGADEIGLE